MDVEVYRVGKNGKLKLVASGFINPGCLQLVGRHLWVTENQWRLYCGYPRTAEWVSRQIDVTKSSIGKMVPSNQQQPNCETGRRD
jgi:hypothetical protein